MNLKYLKYEETDSIGILTISREKELNALNSAVLEELKAVVSQISEGMIRCLILTGEGQRSFVAGADISEMKDMTKEEAAAFGRHGNQVFRMLETLPVPVIAAVNGYALGGGFELALACDLRIASENAMFSFPETGLGIMPGFGGTQRCVRLMGMNLAKELIFTGRRMKAAEARERGLVMNVVPSENLLQEALTAAGKIAALSAKGVANAKAATQFGADLSLEDGLALETKYFANCFEEEDQRNKMNQFVNKSAKK